MVIKYPDIFYSQTTDKSIEPLNIVERWFLTAIKMDKFTALSDMLNNPFYSNATKEELANIFHIMQKYNNAFNCFIYRWRYKRMKRFDSDTDLRLNELSNYNPVQVISIVENKTIYDFCLPDLMKIIYNALLYQEHLFSAPTCPKNPYTNSSFGTHNLYNIYFHILESSQIMPSLFYLFFLSDFNIGQFYINNEAILRDESIKSYYKEQSAEEQYNDILTMLNTYAKYVPNIIIHASFPKQDILDKLGTLLPDYLTCQYSYCPTKKSLSRRNIKQFLIMLNKESPKFGRIAYNHRSTSNQFTTVPS